MGVLPLTNEGFTFNTYKGDILMVGAGAFSPSSGSASWLIKVDPQSFKATHLGYVPTEYVGFSHKGFASCVVGDVLYIVGGAESNQGRDIYCQRRVFTYNLVSKEVKYHYTLGHDRSVMTSIVPVGELLYIYGGESDMMEVFDTVLGRGQSLSQDPSRHMRLVSRKPYKKEIYFYEPMSQTVHIFNILSSSWRIEYPIVGGSVITGGKQGLYLGTLTSSGTAHLLGDRQTVPVFTRNITGTKVGGASPMSGFIDETRVVRFSWQLSTTPEGLAQQSAVFEWRVFGGTQINKVGVGSSQYTETPAYTFPNGRIQWRVKGTSADGFESEYTEWFELTTIDIVHGKPTNLNPRANMYDGTKTIQLSWLVHSDMSTPQKAFDIQVSYDVGNTAWITLANKVVQESPTYIVGENQFKPELGGRVTWRVRTYNSDMVVSEWSAPVSFTVLLAPEKPQWISVEQNRNRPVCRWVSDQRQTAWHLQAAIGDTVYYDTGEQQGADTDHKIAGYLERGQYTFRLRIKTDINVWSSWSNLGVSISARGKVKVTIDGSLVENGALLSIIEKEIVADG